MWFDWRVETLVPQVLTEPEQELLRKIARCPLVPIAARDAGHACHQVVATQRADGDVWQVPEGWAGNLHEAQAVFLSSNPGISEAAPDQPPGTAEAYPVAGCADGHITQYLGRRFDPAVVPKPFVSGFRYLQADGRYTAKPVPFWVSMHDRAMELLGPGADPARNYVMTEVVHCKSTMGKGVTRAAPTCAGRYLDAIFDLTQAPVVVVVGMRAHALLKSRFPALPDPPYIHREKLGGRQRELVYLNHPAGFEGKKTIAGLHGSQALDRLRALAKNGTSHL